MTAIPLNAIIIISIAIIRGVFMTAKSTKSKTNRKKQVRLQKSRLLIKKQQRKIQKKQPDLPEPQSPVIVF